jgi:hypothetical protein
MMMTAEVMAPARAETATPARMILGGVGPLRPAELKVMTMKNTPTAPSAAIHGRMRPLTRSSK